VLFVILLGLAWLRIISPAMRGGSQEESALPAIKVVVKNGCGVERLATDYAGYIQNQNIDVVSLGDVPHPVYNKSLIEVKHNDRQDLQRLQKMTGITRYALAEDTGAEAPFVIILGADYEEYMK
jgi:hypothetical protein